MTRQRLSLILTLALFVSLPPPSQAQDLNIKTRNMKDRKIKSKLDEKKAYELEEQKKNTISVPQAEKRRPVDLQAFDRSVQENVQVKTEDQIRTLEELIKDAPDTEKAELFFRLAEHYWENAKYFDFEGHKYDDFRRKSDWPEKQRLQKAAWEKAKGFRKKAAVQYFNVIKNYPKFPRLCESYYFLGKNLFEMGEEKQALSVFTPMIAKFRTKYPKCPFIPDAYLSFGEHYFNAGSVRNALKAYEQVLFFRDSTIYGFAMYKIGWCHYNLVQYDKALKTFVDVVRLARKQIEEMGVRDSRRLALLKEALRDLVLAYSQTGDPNDAKRFFMEIGGEKNYVLMLRNLGSLYRQQGKIEGIIVVYGELMKIDADSPNILRYQLYITRAYDVKDGKSATIRETRKLASMIQEVEKSLGEDAKKKATYEDAMKEVEPQMKEYAKYRHYEAQKTRNNQFLAEAMEFYDIYLSVFGKRKEAYEMHFWLGEIYYRLRKFQEATKHYKIVYTSDPKGKFSQDASYNTILAFDLLMKRDRIDISDMTSKKTTEKKPLPDVAKGFLEACEDFLKYYGTGERALEVSYKAALIYYYFNHFENALPRFYFLVEKYPSHEYAVYSAHFILDTFQLQKEWDRLNKDAWKFYKTPRLGDKKFKGEMRELITGSGFKICSAITESKKHIPAADCFLKLATEFPENKKLAAQSLYNASYNYSQAKQPEKALRLRHDLLEKYPNSEFEKETVVGLADNYASRADFATSVTFYEKFIDKYPKDPKRMEFLKQAALLREALGDEDRALAHYNAILKDKTFQSKEKKEFAAIYLRVAENYKKKGNLSRYANMLKEYEAKRMGDSTDVFNARVKFAFARKKLGFRTEAEKIFKGVPSRYNGLSEKGKSNFDAVKVMAYIHFLQAEEVFAEYKKIKMKRGLTQAELKKSIAEKEKAFEKAQKAFASARKFKNPEWLAGAFYRQAEICEDMAQFYVNAPVPDFRKDVEATLQQHVKQTIRENIKAHMRQQGMRGSPPAALVNRFTRDAIQRLKAQGKVNEIIQKQEDGFRTALQQKAMPFEAKAIEFYSSSLAVANLTKVFTKWTTLSIEKLQKMRSSMYPQFWERRPELGFLGEDFQVQSGIAENAPSGSAEAPKSSSTPLVAKEEKE